MDNEARGSLERIESTFELLALVMRGLKSIWMEEDEKQCRWRLTILHNDFIQFVSDHEPPNIFRRFLYWLLGWKWERIE